MSNYTMSYPLIGAPLGRLMVNTRDDSPPRGAAVIEVLNRYGDILPRTGTVEIFHEISPHAFCDYTFLRPGFWSLEFRPCRDPRPSENLPHLPLSY